MPSSYKEFTFDTFRGGYNTDLDPEMLPKQYLQAGQNVLINKGYITKRDAHQTYNAFAFTGTVDGIYVFQLSSGTSYLVVATTSHLYYYNTGTATWSDITPAAHALNGVTSTPPQFISFEDMMYMTNNVDPIVQWAGGAVSATYMTGLGAPDHCLSIQAFAGYLFAIQPTVSATLHGWRAMWTDLRNPTVWNSGQAGSVDLDSTPDLVLSATVTSRWMSIYKTSSIYNAVFIGPPAYFDFTQLNQPGPIAPRSIVEVPMVGFAFLGKDDIYIFDGVQSRPIGKSIRQEVFSKLNYTNPYSPIAWRRPDLGYLYFGFPWTATVPDTVFTYSYFDGEWMPDGPYSMLAGTYADYSQVLTVGQLVGTVGNQTMTIAQLARNNQKVNLITDGTNLYSFLSGGGVDFITPTNVAINSSFQTASVPLAQDQNGQTVPCIVYGIKLLANDSTGNISVTLGASIGNDTYNSFGPYLVSTTNLMQTIIPCEVYGQRFQVTVANANLGETFAVKQIGLLYRPAAGSRV